MPKKRTNKLTDCSPDHLDCAHRDYIGRAVTLNGKPAKVVKLPTGSPCIAPLDTRKGIVPYSWVAVMNVCDNHKGRFE